MSLLSTLPAYFVFGQQPLNVATTAERIADFLTPQDSQQKTVLVFLDQLLLHAASQLQAHVQLILQVINHGLLVSHALKCMPNDATISCLCSQAKVHLTISSWKCCMSAQSMARFLLCYLPTSVLTSHP